MNDLLISGPTAEQHRLARQDKLTRHTDAGMDLYPNCPDESCLSIRRTGFQSVWSIPTGMRLLIPEGFVGIITGRSSSIDKLMGCPVLMGVIDAGFTGEYLIRLLVPVTDRDFLIQLLVNRIVTCSQERVALAQLLVLPYHVGNLCEVAELPVTPRGASGFGSTDAPSVTGATYVGPEALELGNYQSGGSNQHHCQRCGVPIRPWHGVCPDCTPKQP